MLKDQITLDEYGVQFNLSGGLRFRREPLMPLCMLVELLLLVVLLLSLSGCQSGTPESDFDDLEATLLAEASATRAGIDDLRLTREVVQTAAAQPTATVTPMGTVYDAGDGLLTTVFVNLSGTGLIGGGSVRVVVPGEAHNYLFNAQAGDYEIWVGAVSGDPKLVLIDPSGLVVAFADNSEDNLGAHLEVSLGDGIHTLRVSGNGEATYNVTLHQK